MNNATLTFVVLVAVIAFILGYVVCLYDVSRNFQRIDKEMSK